MEIGTEISKFPEILEYVTGEYSVYQVHFFPPILQECLGKRLANTLTVEFMHI